MLSYIHPTPANLADGIELSALNIRPQYKAGMPPGVVEGKISTTQFVRNVSSAPHLPLL